MAVHMRHHAVGVHQQMDDKQCTNAGTWYHTNAASFGSVRSFRICLISCLYADGAPVENGSIPDMISETVITEGPSEMSWSKVEGRK